MSIIQKLLKDIETNISKHVHAFIHTVSEKYSLDNEELLRIWSEGSAYSKSELSLSSSSSPSMPALQRNIIATSMS